MNKDAVQPSLRGAAAGAARLGAVLPTLVLRPSPVFSPALPVLRAVHGQRQLSLDLRLR